jgi:uracil-DNA glycosylase
MPPVPESLERLNDLVVHCTKCPRLVAWRHEVAETKRASFAHEDYWARPITGFGDSRARLLVLGLAPAAHGGNRTGRVFTGDRSGDWLFAALHRAGYANQPTSTHIGDGLTLKDCYVTAAVRCAPPANKPTPSERDNCLPYVSTELDIFTRLKVIVSLGSFAWDAALRVLSARGLTVKPKPRFGHLSEVRVGPYVLVGSYHPSQQNTFTGTLTEPMFDAVFARAKELS